MILQRITLHYHYTSILPLLLASLLLPSRHAVASIERDCGNGVAPAVFTNRLVLYEATHEWARNEETACAKYSHISDWDVSGMKTFADVFEGLDEWEGENLGQWNTSSATSMHGMFRNCESFTGEGLGRWDVSHVTSFAMMFHQAFQFREDIGDWDVGNANDFSSMFSSTHVFNKDLGEWNTSRAETMSGMFYGAWAFNHSSITEWDVTNVKDFSNMFRGAVDFNVPIESWEMASAVTLKGMFQESEAFNRSLSEWNVATVQDMSEMFRESQSFNGEINEWKTSSVKDMSIMFYQSKAFNRPINDWDVSNVRSFRLMFAESQAFNQPLHSFDISSAETMDHMFYRAQRFNQNLQGWNPENCRDFRSIFSNSAFDQTLCWNTVSPEADIGGAFDPPTSLTGPSCPNFVPTPLTDETIFRAVEEWRQDDTTGDDNWGCSTPECWGYLPGWNTSLVTNMGGIFWGAYEGEPWYGAFDTALDVSKWDTRNVVSMSYTFNQAQYIPDISMWNVAAVENMEEMFYRANVEFLDLTNWDTSSVTNMRSTFYGVTGSPFPDLSRWDVGSVLDMHAMFKESTIGKVDLSEWETYSVRDFSYMFEYASNFTSDLSDWNVEQGEVFTNMFLEASSFESDISAWRPRSAQQMGAMLIRTKYEHFNCPWINVVPDQINLREDVFGDDILQGGFLAGKKKGEALVDPIVCAECSLCVENPDAQPLAAYNDKILRKLLLEEFRNSTCADIASHPGALIRHGYLEWSWEREELEDRPEVEICAVTQAFLGPLIDHTCCGTPKPASCGLCYDGTMKHPNTKPAGFIGKDILELIGLKEFENMTCKEIDEHPKSLLLSSSEVFTDAIKSSSPEYFGGYDMTWDLLISPEEDTCEWAETLLGPSVSEPCCDKSYPCGLCPEGAELPDPWKEVGDTQVTCGTIDFLIAQAHAVWSVSYGETHCTDFKIELQSRRQGTFPIEFFEALDILEEECGCSSRSSSLAATRSLMWSWAIFCVVILGLMCLA